jgi:hypothetical protein
MSLDSRLRGNDKFAWFILFFKAPHIAFVNFDPDSNFIVMGCPDVPLLAITNCDVIVPHR